MRGSESERVMMESEEFDGWVDQDELQREENLHGVHVGAFKARASGVCLLFTKLSLVARNKYERKLDFVRCHGFCHFVSFMYSFHTFLL